MGSIIAEWNACDVISSRDTTFSAASLRSNSSSASNDPETTHSEGALMAAIESPSASRDRSSASGKRTESMPPGGKSCIILPRAATTESASSSENTPAKQAAANSPTLCPSIAAGWIPQLIQSCASAYSIVKMAGCAISVSVTLRFASSDAPSDG